MSNTSLYSGMYMHIRDFAELIDKVLIDLKAEGGTTLNESRRKLGEIFLAMGSGGATGHGAHLLEVILQEKLHENVMVLKKLGKEIISSPPSPQLIERLEEVAKALEQERAGTFAKMRGY